MGRVLKACALFLTRFVCAIFLSVAVVLAAMSAATVMGLAGGLGVFKLSALGGSIMLVIFLVCFASKNTKRTRALVALKTIGVCVALVVVWWILDPPRALPNDPEQAAALMVGEFGGSSMLASMLIYSAALILPILWLPSLSIRGKTPVPNGLYRFEKFMIGYGVFMMAFGYFTFDTIMQGFFRGSPLMTEEMLMRMPVSPLYSFVFSAIFFVVSVAALTRIRLIIMRPFFLIWAILMVPGTLINFVVLAIPAWMVVVNILSVAFLIYCVYLLYRPEIGTWVREAKAEFEANRISATPVS